MTIRSYTITGNEDFLKERAIASIQRKYSQHILEEYEGGKDDKQIQQCLQEAVSPFFSKEKLVLVREVNRIKNPKILKSYCENPVEGRILVAVTGNSGRDPKWIVELPKTKNIPCEKIKEWEIPEWVSKESQRMGLKLGKGYSEALVLNVGTNLYALSNELEKLKIYSDGEPVTEQMVKEVLYGQNPLSPFDILSFWGKGNSLVTVQYIVRHFEKTPDTQRVGSALVLLNLFLERIENLIKARSMKDRGSGDKEIAEALGKTVWFYRNQIEEQVKKRSVERLVYLYQQMCSIDEQIKTGKDGYQLLLNFVYNS